MRLTRLFKSEVVLVTVFCFLVGLTVTVNPISGQERFGSLNGLAMDETGAVLPGVTVTVTHKTTNRAISAVTGSEGTYSIRNIEPGRYSIKFELPGFSAIEFPDINVLVGQTLKIDGSMRVGGVETTIEVTDVVPLIDTQSTLVATNIPAEEFIRLPKTRSFQSLAMSAAAVNSGEIEGGFQVNGASGSENSYNIDGVTTNSLISGHSRQNAAFEYLQEVQVKTAGIDAEYGGALGGVITAVTKSGGNEFHGEGHFYYTGSSLMASPVRRLNLDPREGAATAPFYRATTFIQDNKDSEHNYEPGFSLGGPIKSDRLYFFTAWSPRWRFQDINYLFANGTEPDVLTRDQTYWSGFNKLSFDATDRIRGNFSLLWTPTSSKGNTVAFRGAGPNWDSATRASQQGLKSQGFFQPQSNYSGNIDFIVNNNVLISGRGGYFWDNFKALGIPDISPVEYRISSIGLAGVPSDLQGGIGFTNTPRTVSVRSDLTTRAYGQIDLTASGNLGGLHNIKTGYNLTKNVNNVNRSYGGGGYVFVFWDSPFTASPTGIVDRGAFGYYTVNQVGTIGTTGAGIKSFYVQDTWTVHPQVTLNLGLRAEQERIPSFRRDIRDFAFDFGWSEKISPRVGASIDLYGDGRIKLYGSFGRYYDWTKYELVRGTFGGDVQRIWYRSLDSADAVRTLSFTNKPGRDLWLRTGDSFKDERIPSFGDTAVDPNLKPMSQDQFTFGVDYQINTEMVMGARYVRNDLRDTIEDLGVLVNGSEVYIYGNPGKGLAKRATPSTATPAFDYPEVIRTYDAVELTVTRRLSAGWFGSANYTWSRLWGNYAGLANSDEVRTPTLGYGQPVTQQTGASIFRQGGNATRGWDLDELLFDSKGNLDVKGPLATDRPHVFKLNGGFEKNWGRSGTSDIGMFFYLGSGTPLSTIVNTIQHISVLPFGRGDMGRTKVLNYTDLSVGHTFSVAETQRVRVEFNMLNAFNQKSSRHRFDRLNRGDAGTRDSSSINLGPVNLNNGYDVRALINASADGANAFEPRYGLDDLFSAGFAGRFGVNWTF